MDGSGHHGRPYLGVAIPQLAVWFGSADAATSARAMSKACAEMGFFLATRIAKDIFLGELPLTVDKRSLIAISDM